MVGVLFFSLAKFRFFSRITCYSGTTRKRVGVISPNPEEIRIGVTVSLHQVGLHPTFPAKTPQQPSTAHRCFQSL